MRSEFDSLHESLCDIFSKLDLLSLPSSQATPDLPNADLQSPQSLVASNFLPGLSTQKTSFTTALPSYPPKSPSPSLIPKQQPASSPTSSSSLTFHLTLIPHHFKMACFLSLKSLLLVQFLRLFILLSLSLSLLPFLITSSCSSIRLPQCVESSSMCEKLLTLLPIVNYLIGSSLTYAPIPNQSESATLSCPLFLCHQESLKGRYSVPSCFLFLLMKWVSSLSHLVQDYSFLLMTSSSFTLSLPPLVGVSSRMI